VGREHFLAGIGGYRPDLSYSAVDDQCTVTFPGYRKAIAILPSNTVDAVFTSKGMLAYRDSMGEVRALQLSDHEPIYKAAVAAAISGTEVKSFVTGKPIPTFSQVMGRHVALSTAAGTISTDSISAATISTDSIATGKLPGGTVSVDKVAEMKIKTGDLSREGFEKFAASMVRDYISPLVSQIQRLTKMNLELASRVKELEKQIAGMPESPPTSTAPPAHDMPIREVSWGERGGLPNLMPQQDNPFCARFRR
jgi:hypothetical protein